LTGKTKSEEAAKMSKSNIYRVTNCPIPTGEGNHHAGLDALLSLMSDNGLKLYRTHKVSDIGSVDGCIDREDVVLIKVNAQWKYRGATNSDVIRGLIQRILEHPDGFNGEIVIFENGQSVGSMNCDMMRGNSYPEGVHANAEDENHSFSYLVISSDDHLTDGYRKLTNVSYPCFTTAKGNRIELKEGIWNGAKHNDNLKLINVPVLKHHGGCGITGALKNFYGVLSMVDGKRPERHYAKLGQHCGEMVALVRTPVINILDCIWVTQVGLAGYPPEKTTRLNQLLASIDPVALDYWAAKHLFYPIDNNVEHHPDRFSALQDGLIQAQEVINSAGGIYGQKVTMDEFNINVIMT
jgi:uncharacterized protein (DUF362 family)